MILFLLIRDRRELNPMVQETRFLEQEVLGHEALAVRPRTLEFWKIQISDKVIRNLFC